MLIEHVLGFRVDALHRTSLRRHLPGRTGIRNLRCGDTRVTVVADGTALTIETDGPITLSLPDRDIPLTPGHPPLVPSGSFPGRAPEPPAAVVHPPSTMRRRPT